MTTDCKPPSPMPRRALAAAVFAAAALAACGGGGGDDATAPASGGGGNGGASDTKAQARAARGNLLDARLQTTLTRCAILRDPSCGGSGGGLLPDGLVGLAKDLVAARLPDAGIALVAQCEVEVHRIEYATVTHDGSAARNSGMVMLPRGASPRCAQNIPSVIYSRGTQFVRAAEMAALSSDGVLEGNESRLLAATLAGQGVMVVASDYLGYGGSTAPHHPYMHIETQAASGVDAYRAALALAAQRNTALSGKVFSTGYSQGGHASMAVHKILERDFPAVQLTASMHLAGPYALEQTVLEGPLANPWDLPAPYRSGTVMSPLFGPLIFANMRKTYGDEIYSRADEVWAPPWSNPANDVDNLLPGSLGPSALYATGRLPNTLAGMLNEQTDAFTPQPIYTDAFLQRLNTDPAMPLRQRLRENSFVVKDASGRFVANGWTPRTPYKLCSGNADPNADYRINGTAVKQAFGLPDADAMDVDPVAVEMARLVVRAKTLTLAPTAKQVQRQINNSYHAEYAPLLCLSAAGNYFARLR
jgi:hypothetical protein